MDPIIEKMLREAGQLILRSLNRSDDIQVHEKKPNDFVTEMDRRIEDLLIDHIRKVHPHDAILTEERGVINPGKSNREWIIDPLDGTRNYIQRIPHYCISVALRVGGVIQEGAVYDPIKEELFTAKRGSGARLNSHRIRVKNAQFLKDSIIGFGFPFRHSDAARDIFFKQWQALAPQCADMRRTGSAALDLAYVAAGRFDGFFEYGLEIWDIAAGALLVQEAGGLVGDFCGSDAYLESGDIVAANPKIFKALMQSFSKIK